MLLLKLIELDLRDCFSQLFEQLIKLTYRSSLPLLEVVDTLLHEVVFLSHISVLVVVIASQQLFLLFKGLILTSQSQ